MIDVYHLFKLGTATLRVVKASKGSYNAMLIFKNVWKPLAVMGISGMADAACEEASELIIKTLEEKTNGCSR